MVSVCKIQKKKHEYMDPLPKPHVLEKKTQSYGNMKICRTYHPPSSWRCQWIPSRCPTYSSHWNLHVVRNSAAGRSVSLRSHALTYPSTWRGRQSLFIIFFWCSGGVFWFREVRGERKKRVRIRKRCCWMVVPGMYIQLQIIILYIWNVVVTCIHR